MLGLVAAGGSLFVLPYVLAPAGVALGLVAARRGQLRLGLTVVVVSVILGAASVWLALRLHNAIG